MRRRALCAGQGALHFSGAGHLWLHRGGTRHAAILMYHSVADAEAAPWIAPRNRISPARFRRQMQYLASRRNVLSLSEAVGALREGRELPLRAVVITFDDGYRDNLEVAAPILAELGLPATIFVCTGYLESGKPQWADRLYAALSRTDKAEVSAAGLGSLPLGGRRSASAYDALTSSMIALPDQERDAVLEDLERQLGVEQKAPRCTLIWEEARSLRTTYPAIELGAHTSSHADLSSLAPDAAVAEVRQSGCELEAATGERPAHFSFPYSRASEAVIQRLPELGFQSAMVGVGGQPSRGDPMRLLRWEAPSSLSRLAVLTSGAMPSLSQRVFGRE